MINIEPLENDNKNFSNKSNTGIRWSRETQKIIRELLCDPSNEIEFIPTDNWIYTKDNIPFAVGKLKLNGEDFAKRLISMDLVATTKI